MFNLQLAALHISVMTKNDFETVRTFIFIFNEFEY
jgi:hypothetical protein